jgi:PAS domain S-box-containing protein
VKLLGADRGDVALWQPSTNKLVIEATVGKHYKTFLSVGDALPDNSMIQALWDNPVELYQSAPNVEKVTRYCSAHPDIRSELCVKVMFSYGQGGVLNVESRESSKFTRSDIMKAQLIARFASTAIAFAGEEYHVWRQLTRTLKYSVGEEEVLKDILESLGSLYALDSGAIFTRDSGGGITCGAHILNGVITEKKNLPRFVVPSQSLANCLFETGKSIYIANPYSDKHVYKKLARALGVVGPLAGVLLSANREDIGTLLVWSHSRKITKNHIHYLEAFARLAALRMAHAKKEKSLRRQEEFSNLLADNLPGFVFCKDSEFKFTFANTKFAEECKTTPHEIRGKSDYDFYEHKLASKYRLDDIKVLGGKEIDTIEKHRLPGGSMRYVHVIKTPLRDGDNEIFGVQGIYHDVTMDVVMREATFQEGNRVDLETNINQCNSLEDLYRYCAFELPKHEPFNATYASIFTFSEPKVFVAPDRKLVLRDSNYPRLKSEKNQAVYAFHPASETFSLTEWVACNNRSLRLENLDDKAKLRRELSIIDRKLRHKMHIEDSDRHDTFLAVPISQHISSKDSDVLGVIRFAQKKGRRRFSDLEQRLLEYLVEHSIAPRLADLMRRQFTDKLIEHTDVAKRLSSTSEANDGLSYITISETLNQFFGGSAGNANRVFWLTRHSNDGKMRQCCFYKGSSERPKSHLLGASLPVAGSVDEIATKSADLGYICVTDVSNVRDPLLPKSRNGVRCVVACRIRFRHDDIGVLCVASSSYDIDQPYHGKLLELVASELAQALYLQAIRPTFTQPAFRHDTIGALMIAHYDVESLLRRANVKRVETLVRGACATKFCLYLAQAYCRSYGGPFDRYKPSLSPCVLHDDAIMTRRMVKLLIDEGDDIIIRIPNDLRVDADANVIVAILFNLLRNAREYGKSASSVGKIVLSASVTNHTLTIIVSDNGPGMTQQQVDDWVGFDIGRQVSAGLVDSLDVKRGLGLKFVGLLVRNWEVDGRCGKWHYEYCDGLRKCGSKFVITLPVRKAKGG